jgi:hypothetical protein
MVRVSPDLILEDQWDCPPDSTGAYIGWLQLFWRVAESRKNRMNMTDKSWAPALPGVREGLSPSAFKLPRSGRVGRLESSDVVPSTTRKRVRTISVGKWFWVGVLFIIVPFGLTIWLVRRLYLTWKEKSDERWEGTLL